MKLNRRDFLMQTGLAGLALASDLIVPNLSFSKSNYGLKEKLAPYLDELSRKVISIESNWNPRAYRKDTKASGLMQVTPVVLREWNNHMKKKYVKSDLFDPFINVKIGKWYLHKRIGDHYIPHYEFEDTPEMQLACFNAGPSRIAELGVKNAKDDFDKLPLQTQNYLEKYWDLAF